MFEDTGRYHRMPVGFGPAPTPRQDKNGKPFATWKTESEQHLTGIVVNVGRKELQANLPPGYEIDPDVTQPTVNFEVMNLRKLPWLAGRGYNTWGVYANDVICKHVSPPVKASYQLVLFESFTDPISTGREELGMAKVWAEMPDPKIDNGNLLHTASWFGTEFMRLEVPNLQFIPAEELPSFTKRPYTMACVEGFTQHRYVPAVGEPGKHDASYPIFMPGGGDKIPEILSFATTSGPLDDLKLTITSHPFESLPTLWTIVDGLASLNIGSVREFYYQVQKGASDCSPAKRIY